MDNGWVYERILQLGRRNFWVHAGYIGHWYTWVKGWVIYHLGIRWVYESWEY